MTTKILHAFRFTFAPKKGFTMMELLVVIGVLGVLAGIAIVTYGSSQRVARDARRKAELKQIQAALITYYQDHNNTYPGLARNSAVFTSGSTWFPEITPYLAKQPIDPINTGGAVWSNVANFSYSYQRRCSGDSFALATRLENTNDRDINKKVDTGCGLFPANFGGSNANTYTLTSP